MQPKSKTARPLISLNPIFEGEINLWVHTAFDASVLELLAKARAVIFPQVVGSDIYFFCREKAIPVFPNYDWRFRFPGKIGQFLMFNSLGLPAPKTICLSRLAALGTHPGACPVTMPSPPFVAKGNFGHEGQEVFLIRNDRDWQETLVHFKRREREGKYGVLLQEYLPSPFELRVITCGRRLIPVWKENPGKFKANLSQGGSFIPCPDSGLEKRGLFLARQLLEKTGLNLAAIDFLLRGRELLLNEINYVFGRRAVGGSEAFYQLWKEAIKDFLRDLEKVQSPSEKSVRK